MAATKRQMNWGPVVWTPTSGSPVTITGVTNVAITSGGSVVPFSGDGDRFPTTIVNDMNSPGMTITAADVIAISGIANGTRGTLAATSKDAKLATGGAITYTLVGAIVQDNSSSGAHRAFGQAVLQVVAESADGTTNPLSYATA